VHEPADRSKGCPQQQLKLDADYRLQTIMISTYDGKQQPMRQNTLQVHDIPGGVLAGWPVSVVVAIAGCLVCAEGSRILRY
jgi:hypothetical protein